MSGNGFDPKHIFGSGGGDLTKTVTTAYKLHKHLQQTRLRRQLEQEGWDAATINAALQAHKDNLDVEAVLAAAKARHATVQEQARLRRTPPPIHGSARFATAPELRRAGFLQRNSGSGISLGTLNGEPVTWQGEGHLLTIAPTRTGKATMQIIPNLLRYRGAAVVLDPKGELYAATADWRRTNVGPVFKLDPFSADTHAFNPLDTVTDQHSANLLAETIFPRSDDPRQDFFDSEAIAFLTGLLEFAGRYLEGERKTLAAIRDYIPGAPGVLDKLIRTMADPAMPQSIRNAAVNFASKTRDTGKPRVFDSLNKHLRIWDNPGLRRATARTDFAFEDLKDTPATVYLILPFAEITAFSTYIRMVFATALDAMLKNPTVPPIPVLFVLDEFLALDADDRFVSAMRTHAGAGVRLWFLLQNLATLEQKYPTTWKSFLDADVKTFFGTDDLFTARMISDMLGDHTVAYDKPSVSATAAATASYSIGNNVEFTGRKLLTPDEVLEHLAGDSQGRPALHKLKNLRPITTQLVPYFADVTLRGRTS